ncbi:MAG: hypothetical protein NTW02_06120 [Cyanobium sp. LacPavin_0920_WC12_MAG_62_9]|nr:hypothetical protein [Cyanobium sp. LacPavin_0920_WC12_MAG_62_9]
MPRVYGHLSEGPRAWCIDLEHLIDGLRAKPRALLHCRYQRQLFPDNRWWDFWQQLLVGSGDRDAAARLMVEALYVAVRVASFELVLPFLNLPDPVIPRYSLASYDHLLPRSPRRGSGSGPATRLKQRAGAPVNSLCTVRAGGRSPPNHTPPKAAAGSPPAMAERAQGI